MTKKLRAIYINNLYGFWNTAGIYVASCSSIFKKWIKDEWITIERPYSVSLLTNSDISCRVCSLVSASKGLSVRTITKAAGWACCEVKWVYLSQSTSTHVPAVTLAEVMFVYLHFMSCYIMFILIKWPVTSDINVTKGEINIQRTVTLYTIVNLIWFDVH